MHTYIYTKIRIHIYIHACTYIHVYKYTYISIYTCTYTYMYMYICIYCMSYVRAKESIHRKVGSKAARRGRKYVHSTYIYIYIFTYMGANNCLALVRVPLVTFHFSSCVNVKALIHCAHYCVPFFFHVFLLFAFGFFFSRSE